MKTQLPVIETKNLILRKIEESDAMDMYEYAKLDYVGPMAGWEPHDSINHTKLVIKNFNRKPQFGGLGVFAITLKKTGKMIGTIELHTYVEEFKAELGYTVSPMFWGHEYAVEAGIEVIKWGFNQLKLKRIECTCFTTNHNSQRVCEKLHFPFEGVRRKGYKLYNGLIGDLACYAMTDDDYHRIVDKYGW